MSRIESASIAFYSNMADVETMNVIREMAVSAANTVLPLEQRNRFGVHLHIAQDSDRWSLAVR